MGLAPVVVEMIFETIQKLNAEGITILLVEQNAAMALQIAHRGYVLETGSVALEGPGKELLTQRARPQDLPRRGVEAPADSRIDGRIRERGCGRRVLSAVAAQRLAPRRAPRRASQRPRRPWSAALAHAPDARATAPPRRSPARRRRASASTGIVGRRDAHDREVRLLARRRASRTLRRGRGRVAPSSVIIAQQRARPSSAGLELAQRARLGEQVEVRRCSPSESVPSADASHPAATSASTGGAPLRRKRVAARAQHDAARLLGEQCARRPARGARSGPRARRRARRGGEVARPGSCAGAAKPSREPRGDVGAAARVPSRDQLALGERLRDVHRRAGSRARAAKRRRRAQQAGSGRVRRVRADAARASRPARRPRLGVRELALPRARAAARSAATPRTSQKKTPAEPDVGRRRERLRAVRDVADDRDAACEAAQGAERGRGGDVVLVERARSSARSRPSHVGKSARRQQALPAR